MPEPPWAWALSTKALSTKALSTKALAAWALATAGCTPTSPELPPNNPGVAQAAPTASATPLAPTTAPAPPAPSAGPEPPSPPQPAQLPQAQLPQAQLPQAQLPQAQLPQAQLPQAQLPQVRLENIGLHVGGGSNTKAEKEPFKRALAAHFDAFRHCYRLVEQPAKPGTLSVDLRIEKPGGNPQIQQLRSALGPSAFRACMRKAVQAVAFEPLPRGATVISYSLRFSPQ